MSEPRVEDVTLHFQARAILVALDAGVVPDETEVRVVLRQIEARLKAPAPGLAALTVREACRRRHPLDGADAEALEHALTITERERDEARTEVQRLALLIQVANAAANLEGRS
jgi:hypothetical protein